MDWDALFITGFIVSVAALVVLTATGRVDVSRAYVLAVVLIGTATLVSVMIDVDLPQWASGGGVLNRARVVPCTAVALAVGLWVAAGLHRRR